jgi:hypothetical protein
MGMACDGFDFHTYLSGLQKQKDTLKSFRVTTNSVWMGESRLPTQKRIVEARENSSSQREGSIVCSLISLASVL